MICGIWALFGDSFPKWPNAQDTLKQVKLSL